MTVTPPGADANDDGTTDELVAARMGQAHAGQPTGGVPLAGPERSAGTTGSGWLLRAAVPLLVLAAVAAVLLWLLID